jgi:CheY-like chemotaxis protein
MANIIIIDDEKVVRDLLKRLFISDDTNVFIAEDGLKALEIARNNPIDLALIDIRMPGLDGLRTYQELRNINPNLACIFITGYAVEEALFDKTRQPGMICLKKPFEDIRQLKEIVNKALEGISVPPIFPQATQERRAYVRLNMTLEVDYKIKDKQEQFAPSLSQDIAPGGIRIITRENLPVGTVLDLVIKSSGDKRVCDAQGKVVWSKKSEDKPGYYLTGIKFANVDLSKLAQIIINSGDVK